MPFYSIFAELFYEFAFIGSYLNEKKQESGETSARAADGDLVYQYYDGADTPWVGYALCADSSQLTEKLT